MTGLRGEDGRGRGEERGISKEVGSAKVSGNASALDYTGSGQHGGDVSEDAAEVKVTSGDGGAAELLDDRRQGGLMGSLIALDDCDLLDRNVGVAEASALVIGGLERREDFLVHLSLKLLKDIGELEDQQVRRV